ncbi:MAG: hypothetical protein JXQ96_14110 [Cyclobacteriaceae bacterium]
MIEFVKTTPDQDVVRINSCLEPQDAQNKLTHFCYVYTALNEKQGQYIETSLVNDFIDKMKYWERGINHYLTKDRQSIPGDLS